MNVRLADAHDAERLAQLLRSYLDEGYPDHAGSSADELRRDIFGASGRQHVLVVERDGVSIGFLAWDEVYDMHWALRGAQIADLYVAPAERGHGAALLLIARACKDTSAIGGTFLRGGAYDRASTRRFFARLAVVGPAGDTHLSGRAFRHLAQLQDASVRGLLRTLPPQQWNLEA